MDQALQAGWAFQQKTPARDGLKFGQDYKFENFEEYWQWIAGRTKLRELLSYSLLLGTAYVLLLDDQEGLLEKGNDYTLPDNPEGRYQDFRAFYPLAGNQGVEVEEVDPLGNPTKFKFTIQINLKTQQFQKVIHAGADRVLQFDAPKREMRYGGTPGSRASRWWPWARK